MLAPDAPLTSAINRRLDTPHFGTFATTPRRLAAGRRERSEDRAAFLEVIDRTDRNWRAVSYAIQAVSYAIRNVRQCWEHQGQLEAILAYQLYADQVASEGVERLADLQTTSFPRSEGSSSQIRAGREPTTEIHWRERETVTERL